MAANSSHMLPVRVVRWRLLPQPHLRSVFTQHQDSSKFLFSAALLNLPWWCDRSRGPGDRGQPRVEALGGAPRILTRTCKQNRPSSLPSGMRA